MNNRIDTYDDLYKFLREKLEYKYGYNPKYFVVNRFEEEMKYIKKHDTSRYFIRYYNILRNLIDKDIPFWIAGSIGRYFIAYLLGLSNVNPLPVHYHCEKCCYTRKTNVVKNGFDLPKKNCPECNCELIGDGHNLNFKNTDNRELDCIDIRTCEEGVKLATQIIKEEFDALPIISTDNAYRWCFNPAKKLYELLKDVDNPEEHYGIQRHIEADDYYMIKDYERVLLVSNDLVNELYGLSKAQKIAISDISIYESKIFKNAGVYIERYHINIGISNISKNNYTEEKSFYNLIRDIGQKQIYVNSFNDSIEYDIYDADSLFDIKNKYHLFPRSHNIEYLIIALKRLCLNTMINNYSLMTLEEKVEYVQEWFYSNYILDSKDADIVLAFSKLLVYYVIGYDIPCCSKLEDVLSKNNVFMQRIIDEIKYGYKNYIALIESLHTNEFKLQTAEDLTSYQENKDMYALERTIISMFYDGRKIPKIYQFKND